MDNTVIHPRTRGLLRLSTFVLVSAATSLASALVLGCLLIIVATRLPVPLPIQHILFIVGSALGAFGEVFEAGVVIASLLTLKQLRWRERAVLVLTLIPLINLAVFLALLVLFLWKRTPTLKKAVVEHGKQAAENLPGQLASDPKEPSPRQSSGATAAPATTPTSATQAMRQSRGATSNAGGAVMAVGGAIASAPAIAHGSAGATPRATSASASPAATGAPGSSPSPTVAAATPTETPNALSAAFPGLAAQIGALAPGETARKVLLPLLASTLIATAVVGTGAALTAGSVLNPPIGPGPAPTATLVALVPTPTATAFSTATPLPLPTSTATPRPTPRPTATPRPTPTQTPRPPAPTATPPPLSHGTLAAFPIPAPNADAAGITVGPDGALWFVEAGITNGTVGNNVGRLTLAGSFTEYPIPTLSSFAEAITVGPDAALWFTELDGHKIGRVTTSGAFKEFTLPVANSAPGDIKLGPDGALWFTEIEQDGMGGVKFNGRSAIGRISTTGTITDFVLPVDNGYIPGGLVSGPDGALWFTEARITPDQNIAGGNRIVRISTAGTLTTFTTPTIDSAPNDITVGPDGALWFTEWLANKIGRMTTSGVFTEYPIPTPACSADGITSGPDGAVWFTEFDGNKIGRVSLTGAVTEYAIPTPASSPFGIVTGPDGALWFTEASGNNIGKLT